jgi:hypothetical protein
MNLREAREAYYEYSGKASDLARQLGFAGIAIIWVFKNEATEQSGLLPREFLWPGVFIVATLGMDLLHYVIGSLMWGRLARTKEKAGFSDDRDFDAPAWVNWPTICLFAGKSVSVVIAYVLLGRVLLVRLF